MSGPSPSAALPPSFSRHQSYSNRSRKRVSTVFSPRGTDTGDVFCDAPSSSSSSSAPALSFPSSAASFRSAPSTTRPQLVSTRSTGIAKRFSPRPAKAAAQTTVVKPVVHSTALGSAGTVDKAQYRLLFEDEYHDEVVEHMHAMERSTMPDIVRMELQPELKSYMKPYLVDFLIEIHQQFRLRPEVLYLSLNIVDRYVSKRVVFKKHYQLVGCAALWIAAKFEDAKEKVPSVETLRDMCCNAYDESAFIQMEGHILNTVGWCIGHPTAESWLRLSSMGTSVEDAETQHITRFIMELTLFHSDFVPFLPSAIAAGSLMVARFLLNKPQRVVDESDPSVEIAFLLDTLLGERLETVSEIVVAKYGHSYYMRSSHFVREQYLKGRRFELHVPAPASTFPWELASSELPVFPPSWSARLSTSGSIGDIPSLRRTNSCASIDSDMPETPTFSPYSENLPVIACEDSRHLSFSSINTSFSGPKPSVLAGKAPPSPRHNGFAVQEPRVIFSSIQQGNRPRVANVNYNVPPMEP